MKKMLKILLIAALASIAFAMSLRVCAATVSELSINSVPTGLATANASDNALNYQWFTINNPTGEPANLSVTRADSPDKIYEVVSDTVGGLRQISGADAEQTAAISVAAGTEITIAVAAPSLRTTSIWITDDTGGVGSARSTGFYWVYFEFRAQNSPNQAQNMLASGREAIRPNAVYSKMPQDRFDNPFGDGEVYVPVSSSAQALSYNVNHTAAERTLVFGYMPYVEGTYNISVACVNSANGERIGTPKSITVPAVTKNADGTKNYPMVQVVPQQVISNKDINGKVTVYKLDPSVQQGTRVHSYTDGEKVYTYKYVEDSAIPNKSYLISLRYIDKTTGFIIATQNETIIVSSDKVTTTTVQVPADFTSNTGRKYVKIAGQPDKVDHLSNNTTKTVYEIYYEIDKTIPTTDYDITVIYNDASSNKEIKRQTITVPFQQAISFVADSFFDFADASGQNVKYTLAVGEQRSITHNFADAKRVYVINYNANGSNLMPTSVTINYVENTKNAKMYSITVDVPINDVLVHISPDKFDFDGKAYTMSSGQSRIVKYNYGDIRTVLNVFFRLEGDVDPSAPNTTPGNTIVDDLQNVTDQIGGDPGTVEEDNIVVNPDENIDIENQYPDDTFEVPENETPLGEGIGKTSSFPWIVTIYGSVILICAVLVMIIIDRAKAGRYRR